jgi:GH35 family endo-1,4-beta-xylanase
VCVHAGLVQENDNGASATSALQWASANGLSVTGHVLLWGEFSGDYMPQDTWTMTAAQLKPRILNHVASTPHYRLSDQAMQRA